MSYILDALKKSEAERARLRPEQSFSLREAPARRARRLPWMITLALLAILALIAFRFWPEKASSGLLTGSSENPAVMLPQAARQPAEKRVASAPAARPAINSSPASPEKPETPAFAGMQARPDHADRQPAAPAAGPMPQPETGHGHPASAPLPRRSELAPGIQARLPAITIQAHVHDADASARMIIVDGRIYHEGETLPGGLVLESITPDGIIAGFEGSRFRMNVFGR